MKLNVALAERGAAEAAPAGNTPSVAQPAPKKTSLPKKNPGSSTSLSLTKLWRGGEKKKKELPSSSSPHVLCKCCRSISNLGGESISCPLPWDTAPTGNQTLSPLGSSDASLAPGLLFQLPFLQEESPGMI